MQVVILCGGQGTRIRDVADDVPKPMIPVGGRPLLWHIMKGFARHGLTEFVLCLGYKGWTIKRYFLDYQLAHGDFSLDLRAPERVRLHGPPVAEDWQITFAETGLDAMTGCRVKRVEKYLRGDDFLVTYGDGVADVDVTRLIEFHKGHGKIGSLTAVRMPGRFGEVELEGPQVRRFAEKPIRTHGRVNAGFCVFRRCFLDRLRDDPSLVLEFAPLAGLAEEGQLMAYRHDGFWHGMDSSRDYRHLNDLWDAGNAPWNTWDLSHVCLAA